MIRKIACAAALSLVFAGGAVAAKSPQDESASAAARAGKDEKKICKRFDNTASRMKSERLCLTKSEWKKFEREQ